MRPEFTSAPTLHDYIVRANLAWQNIVSAEDGEHRAHWQTEYFRLADERDAAIRAARWAR